MDQQNDFWTEKLKKWTALDPVDRLSEILFGLIMVLTFTGSISVSTAGRQEVEQLIWAALGCNFAWGLVDAIMNLMDTLIGRSRALMLFNQLRDKETNDTSRKIIRANISPLLSEVMKDEEVDKLGESLRKLPKPYLKNPMTVKDLLITGQIFLLTFLSTFPVALPFMLITDIEIAMRVSNGVAIALMFAAGYSLAKYSGLRPFKTAVIYTAIGVSLVLLTMALGG